MVMMIVLVQETFTTSMVDHNDETDDASRKHSQQINQTSQFWSHACKFPAQIHCVSKKCTNFETL